MITNQTRMFIGLKKEVVSNVSNYEILLSFDSDLAMVAYREWFDECGRKQMLEWCIEKGHDAIYYNNDI